MAKTKKYYVVWKGRQPGIYESWLHCLQQVEGYQGAIYKSFKTRQEAEQAYQGGSRAARNMPKAPMEFIRDSIAVDAACSGNPGMMEYQGVYVADRRQLFHQGPFMSATNNIGEFLAIVHALAMLKKKNNDLPIYSDSGTGMAWVRNKKVKTTLPRTSRTEDVWNMIDRAEKWLRENSYPNKILKWQTKKWGEIPADFGRK